MSVILKFAALRSGQAAVPTISLSSGSSFQAALASTGSADSPRAAATALATDFVATSLVTSADQVLHGVALAAMVDSLRADAPDSGAELATAVAQALGGLGTADFAADFARVRDSVVASYLVPTQPPAEVAGTLVRAYSIATRSLDGSATSDTLADMLNGAIALPDAVVALRDAIDAPPPDPAPRTAAELVDQINALTTRRQQLSASIDELTFHAEDELDLSELGARRPLSAAYDPATGEQVATPAAEQRLADPVIKPAVTAVVGASPLLRASARRNVVLSATAQQILSPVVLQTIRGLNLDPANTPIAQIRDQLSTAHTATGLQLLDLAGQLAITSLQVGAKASDWAHLLDPTWNLDPVDAPDQTPPPATAAPTSHTAVTPLGVADLILVRAHLSHYERGEVAGIENVLAAEKLTHTARHLDRSETNTTSDQEVTDLRSLAQSTAEQENDHTTVQAVGPTLGPIATQSPGSFAQSVTDQVSTSSNLTSRNRQLSVVTQLDETEQTYEHIIDNTAGAVATSGVYQWLDKVYQAQAFHYGARLLYDLIVPEPASVLLQVLSLSRSGLPPPVRPAAFTVAPSKLVLDNWEYYAAGHQASGVKPPPAAQLVVTESFGGRANSGFPADPVNGTFITAEARSTRIPDGYQAVSYRAVIQASGWSGGVVNVSIGSKQFMIAGPNSTYLRSGALDNETQSLPTNLQVDSDGVNLGVGSITVGIEIICTPTAELLQGWQVDTHAQILDANKARFQAYDQAIANRDANARIFLGNLPATRRTSIVLTELKRAVLELLTAQSFAGFTAIRRDAAGFPFPDAAATLALSAYIRFLEQAVEWDRLAYACYPYFWGTQGSWAGKLLDTEPDDTFAQFLDAGAARVVLAIRPGYEAAFEQFLTTGVVPTTPQLLNVGSPLWVSLVDQLRADAGADGVEVAVDDAWQFSIASDLVRARPDGSIPQWTQDAGTHAWADEADPGF